MIPAALVKPALWALAIAAALVGATWAKGRYDEVRREEGRAEIRAEVALRDAREAQQDAQEGARRAERQQENVNAHIQAAEAASADARGARRAAGELREHIADLEHLATNLAATASDAERAAAAGAARVLAELQRRADERAGILAEYADRAGLAGRLCERQYDALRPAP